MRDSRTLVIIPTYNELHNLPAVVDRITRAQTDVDLLIVDDDSPDGTGELADALARRDPDRLWVLHRSTKEGLGAAYLAGFRWGLDRGYAVLVEMDADGSHAPEQMDRLLDAVATGADVAIGSRYVAGGRVCNWPPHRRVISTLSNAYCRLLLDVDVRDLTAGYRAYRREVLERIDLDAVDSMGYCFQIDLTWRAVIAGAVIVEVPITFTEREQGASKLKLNSFTEGMAKVAGWGIRDRWDKRRRVSGSTR